MGAKGVMLLGGGFMALGSAIGNYFFGLDILAGAVIAGFLFLGLVFVVGEIYLWYIAKKEYKRDPYASALIGRYYFGI